MEAILAILGTLLLGGLIAFTLADLGILKLLEPVTAWVQRVFFGIGRPIIGPEALVGETAVVADKPVLAKDGRNYISKAKVGNEIWTIRLRDPLEVGATIRVVDAKGAVLDVVAAEPS